MKEEGKIIIITAPSGSGKTSITHHLLKQFPVLAFSVSAATRQPRVGETDGKDYYFITEQSFQEHIREDEFVEWEMVYEGKYYGTLKTELHRIWANNQIPVLDIDVKGAIHVQKQFKSNCISIFIQPPSVDVLRKRLESRNTDSNENIETRVNKAAYEISFMQHFDYIIINEILEHACQEANKIVQDFMTKT